MKLIIMTKPTFFVEEDKILTALFDEGLDNLHLYKPGAAPMYSERLLTLLPDECYDHITVHEHFYLKEEYGLRGIHIDDATSPVPDKYKGRLCRTVSLGDNIKEAKKKCDYVFLRNVFADTDGRGKAGCLTTWTNRQKNLRTGRSMHRKHNDGERPWFRWSGCMRRPLG